MHRLLLLLLLSTATASAQRAGDSILRLLRTPADTVVKLQWDRDTLVAGIRERRLRIEAAPGEWATALFTATERRNAPVVLLQHWGGGNKEYFCAEAAALAKKGFGSISIDAPWLWPTHDTSANPVRIYPDNILRSCRAITKLLDWLERQQGPSRFYYVGHSYGATLGGLILAAEPRLRAAVLMAGLGSVSASMDEDLLGQWKPVKEQMRGVFDTARYRLSLMEPEDLVGRSRVPVFYQVARNDQFVLPVQTARYVRAVKPERTAYYATDHVFRNDTAQQERIAWLAAVDIRMQASEKAAGRRLAEAVKRMRFAGYRAWRRQHWEGSSVVAIPGRRLLLRQQWDLRLPDTAYVTTSDTAGTPASVRRMAVTGSTGMLERGGRQTPMDPFTHAEERQAFYLYQAALAGPLLQGYHWLEPSPDAAYEIVVALQRPFAPVRLFIEKKTGLPRKIETTFWGDPVKQVTLWLEDYRPVQGALRPFRYRLEQEGKPYFEATLKQVRRG